MASHSDQKPRSPHPLLNTKSNHTPHSPQARQDSIPHTTFESILPTSPTSTDALVHPEVLSSTSALASGLSRSSRLFGRLGLSRSANRSDQDSAGMSRTIDRKQRKQERAESREKAKVHKLAKKEALQEERARNQWLGGLAWGFDPEAGQNVSVSNGSRCTADAIGRNKQRQTESGSGRLGQVGIEAGGPGKEGRYGYGLLKTRDAELFAAHTSGGLRLQSLGSDRRRKASESSPY